LGKAKEILYEPQTVVAEIKRQLLEADELNDSNRLENDIKKLRKKLKDYDKRQSNLLAAFELGEFDKDEILDRLNNLKRLRSKSKTELAQLIKMRDNISSLENA